MKIVVGLLAVVVTHGATVERITRTGNRFLLKLSDGAAAVDFLNDSSFRYARVWKGSPPELRVARRDDAELAVSETAQALQVRAKHLVLTVDKQTVRLRTAEVDETPLMVEPREAGRVGGSVVLQRSATASARYFGLGARADSAMNIRGRAVTAERPFLISSEGYAEFHIAPGSYRFDLTKPDHYSVEAAGAESVEYYFFYGPSPKDIFEQLLFVTGPIERMTPARFRGLTVAPTGASLLPTPAQGSWQTLQELVHELVNGSLSGIMLPTIDLRPFLNQPDPLRQRARQLASVAPLVIGDNLLDTIRGRLGTYLITYAEEAKDRGFPLVHPMPVQYPRDPEAGKYGDQFMFGDELLVAPIVTPDNRRSVYLPMGVWTNLRTNEQFKGRQVIPIEAAADELPLFSRNGAVVPLGSDPMELHYFPKLGGEFFLFEADLGEYSQVHAAPAGDFMRLEVESKKDRTYQWVVHHVDRPRSLEMAGSRLREVTGRRELGPGLWFHDKGLRNLHVMMQARSGTDHIVNISF